MKTLRNIKNIALFSLAMGCVTTSCDYLDIVPPEQAGLPDATKDAEATLGFLFSCYTGVNSCSPFSYGRLEAGSDEYVLPQLWSTGSQKITWDTNTAVTMADGWRWGDIYRFIGQCHLFMREIDNARGVTDEQKKQWSAEVQFLLAYYHMQALVIYGPCPINDHYVDLSTNEKDFPGRSHFDYVVKWVCDKFDEAVDMGLPATRSGDEWGRATSVMAKALKARLLVYAASPLWNGDFPDRDWKNKNFETPEYGLELVSHNYDEGKWHKALEACIEAKEAAEQAGHKLFQLQDSETLRNNSKIELPYVPLKDGKSGTDAAKDEEFRKYVMLMRYVVATRFDEGNRETIWGIADQSDILMGSLPHRVIKNNQGVWRAGYSGVSPTLNAVGRFYTENGELPSMDAKYYPKSEWFQRAGATGSDLRKDIIKFNTRREPRFYAWIAFDGGDMGSRIMGGEPITLDFKNSEMHGFNTSLFNRDNNVTGYLNQKYFEPTFAWFASSETSQSKPRPLVRMAELYLNLAECYAALKQDDKALEMLNPIRTRAGIRALTSEDLSKMSVMDWVRNERAVEFWAEGHRYYDIRRWMIAKDVMGSGVRKGLNAEVESPSFEVFNTPIEINQPFKWTDRMYLVPLFSNEVYKNPQFVQAPGY